MSTVLLIIIVIVLFTYAYAGKSGAPWVPTKGKDIERFLKLADLKPGQKVYDIGCGDGRIVYVAAKVGVQAVGYEVSILPYLIAKIRSLFNKNCQIKYKNFWKQELSDADLVYFFLMPKHYKKLKIKLQKELRPGSRVMAYVWPFENWEPEKIDKLENFPTIYLYKK